MIWKGMDFGITLMKFCILHKSLLSFLLTGIFFLLFPNKSFWTTSCVLSL